MTWWYNTESGALTSAGTIQSFLQSFQGDIGISAGWHQLPVPATDTEAQAAAEAKKLYPTGTAPTTSTAQQVVQEAGQIAGTSQVIPGLQQIGTFFGALAEGNTWIRVAEGLLGIILIAVGLARLTHAVPAATKIAGAVA
jgi:hypothetical protein